MERAAFQKLGASLGPDTWARKVRDELLRRGPLPPKGAFECLEGTTHRDAWPAIVILCEKGLARWTGRMLNGQKVFEALTDDQHDEAEAAMAAWENRPRRTSKAGKAQPVPLARLRKMKVGEFGPWARALKAIREAASEARRLDAMAFWENAWPDELRIAREELVELRDFANATIDRAIEAIDIRNTDDGTRRKIEKLRSHRNGASHGEVGNAIDLEKKLQAKLPK